MRGLDEIAVDSWLDKNGGDSKNVKYTEFPQNAMAEAVAAGRVDAAQIGDPALSAAIDAGKVRLLAKDLRCDFEPPLRVGVVRQRRLG